MSQKFSRLRLGPRTGLSAELLAPTLRQPSAAFLQDRLYDGFMNSQQPALTRRQLLTLVALGGAGALLAACSPAAPVAPAAPAPTSPGAAPTTSAPATLGASAPTQSGTVTVGLVNFGSDNFDPQVGIISQPYMGAIYDTLLWADKDLNVKPGIAESWEQSADGLTWTFHIRKDMKFHDGTDLTADDVAYNINRIPNRPAYDHRIVRLSIGLESTSDLIADLAQALSHLHT